MPAKKKAKSLRQTKLSEHPLSSPRVSSSYKTSQPLRPSKRERPPSDDNSDDDLSTIKLEPKVLDISDSDSDENPSPTKKKRLVRGSKKVVLSDEEDRPIHKRRRRLTKGRAIESSESDDIADEVEKEHILSSRFRVRDKKTAFQKNLERLKRKKQGKPMDPSTEEETEESESGDKSKPFKGARPSADSDHDSLFDGSESSNSSDFIVEDDGEVVSLPMQFSMETYQDLDHQFKKIFQFFVHIAVRPGTERSEFMKDQIRNQEYFSVPLTVVRRKLSGMRDSLVASSVWRPEFRKALETYPEFDLIKLDFGVRNCDACHLGGRISTLMGRLSGHPYHRSGFELDAKYLGGGSDSDSASSESESEDETPPATVEFNLGRFCGRRTSVFHEFSHWEWAVFKCIRDEMDELTENAKRGKKFYKVAYAGGKRPPKDLTDADGICDWLDSRKIIDREWEKLKAMMESARHLEIAAKNGGGDDDD